MWFNSLCQCVLVFMKFLKSHLEKCSSLQTNFLPCSEMIIKKLKRKKKRTVHDRKPTFSNVPTLLTHLVF